MPREIFDEKNYPTDILGPGGNEAVYKAYTMGQIINVEDAARGGLSFGRVFVPEISLRQSIDNILADPTEEEQAHWQGLSQDEIIKDVEGYIRDYARERGHRIIENL